MSQISVAWQRICSWYEEHDSFANEIFYDGATDLQIAQLESALGFELPKEFKESYRLHNGSNVRRGLFLGGEYLLSLDGVLRAWTLWCDVRGEEDEEEVDTSGQIRDMGWNKRWIPITDSGSGDHYCIDLAPGDSGSMGQIIDLSHEEGPLRVVAQSLSDWLLSFAHLLESGKYQFKDGTLQPAANNSQVDE